MCRSQLSLECWCHYIVCYDSSASVNIPNVCQNAVVVFIKIHWYRLLYWCGVWCGTKILKLLALARTTLRTSSESYHIDQYWTLKDWIQRLLPVKKLIFTEERNLDNKVQYNLTNLSWFSLIGLFTHHP